MANVATDISRHVRETKYRYARALAAVEAVNAAIWQERFLAILQDFKFLPGGRIHAGAGTTRNVTLFNCFVMGTIEDSIPGIFRALQEGALTMQQGGGIGVDFSTLRPRGTPAKGAGNMASGAVSAPSPPFAEQLDTVFAIHRAMVARRRVIVGTGIANCGSKSSSLSTRR